MVVIRTAEHYAGQLQALLPPGPAWDPERVPELQHVITGLSREFARIDGRAFDLLNEMDPATVSELVPDWERVMNLPDPCLGLKPLFADRRVSAPAAGSNRRAERSVLHRHCRQPGLPRHRDRTPNAPYGAFAFWPGALRHLERAIHVDPEHRRAPAPGPTLRGQLLGRAVRGESRARNRMFDPSSSTGAQRRIRKLQLRNTMWIIPRVCRA